MESGIDAVIAFALANKLADAASGAGAQAETYGAVDRDGYPYAGVGLISAYVEGEARVYRPDHIAVGAVSLEPEPQHYAREYVTIGGACRALRLLVSGKLETARLIRDPVPRE